MRIRPERCSRQLNAAARPSFYSLRVAAALALIASVLVLSGGATATAHGAPRTSLADIEQEVMCPTCGTPLMVAQSPLADRERAFIEQRIARGETKAQIEHDMVAQFGPAILAAPPAHGFDLAAYLVPAAAAVAAVLALGLGLRRWRRHTVTATLEPAPSLAPELSRLLDEDMTRHDT